MPQISVIIPVYNAAKTILETTDSVLKQTYSNFELIIINDGSTDNTLEILNDINDDHIKIFSYGNAGEPIARNRGISHSSGEYISFIDADDLWTPDKLELQLNALQRHPDAGVAYSWTVFIDDSGNFSHAVEPIYFEGNVYPELLVNYFIGSWSNILIRMKSIESVGSLDPNLKYGANWEYWIRIASKWPFVVVPQYQILCRIRSGSLSSDVQIVEEYSLKAIDRTFFNAPDEFQSLKSKSLSVAYRYLTFLYLTRMPDPNWLKHATRKLKASIRLYPRTLLSRSSQYYLWTLILLHLLPAKLSSKMFRFLLTMKGKFMMLVTPELRASPIISRKKKHLNSST